MNLARTCVSFLALIATLGCGGGVSNPKVVPVSGTVTIKGKPTAGVDVNFFREKASRAASGRTDAEGKYRLTMFEANDGAIPGKNLVTLTIPGETVSMEQMMSGKAPPAKSPLPPEYSNPTATPFSYEVKDGVNENVNFDVP